MAVAVEIRHTSQSPASRKSWAVRADNKSVNTLTTRRSSTRGGIVKDIVWFPVAVEIGRPYQCIVGRNRWSKDASGVIRSGQIPDGRLARACIEKQVIK